MAGRPAKAYSQATRLVHLLHILSHRWLGATIQELAGELQVSTRTIDRDLQALGEVVSITRCACKGTRGVRLCDRQNPWRGPC